ncbi:hypothetical protein D3OALGB2SA_3860, partial [Olavius algarvensis associated proteobacterium Delta 3]
RVEKRREVRRTKGRDALSFGSFSYVAICQSIYWVFDIAL